MRSIRGGVLLAALALLAGCGSQPRAMDPQVRADLKTTTEQLRAAATGKDRSAAESALQRLTSQVAAAQAAGKIDPSDAQPILAAAGRVAEDVQSMEPPAPVTITVSPTPTTSDQTEQSDENGNGRGKDGRRHGRP